ncbi:DUF2489 domain-containing protein [Microbulbifer flavimaris]|uniref:DUF2489 domain-containing protein n=1 Tax=Microbulbifer flavimaris TaxID=1781068 RepID=A0ABX4I3Y9_9GAMM|nr:MULTISPECIES: DUF2489 domain-containing protein [Microbulbifer]KUJ84669.1 hypothetical protein AVO43_03160 [Microbulbifer sp. ZGT114]PCO06758.1 DUF2489 domain-containing protein [Microbulbifer flavimaris]
MSQFPVWLLILAALVIFILAIIAGFYLRKLQVQQREQARQLSELEEAAEAQRQRVNDSIQILARTLLDEGVGLTEASIRLRVLLDALQVSDTVREEFVVFYTVADKASHIPILKDWKALSRKEQFAFEQEMADLEKEYQDFALDAARRLLGRNF